MSTLKIAVGFLAAAAAGITLWQWLSEDPRPVPARVQVVKDGAIPPKALDPNDINPPEFAAPVAPPSRPVAPPVSTSEFGRKLLETQDVKAFVIDALKHPEKGGAFYAELALRQCYVGGLADIKEIADAAIQKIVAAESTISPERMAAINSGLTRCAGFSDGEIDALKEEAERHALDGSDPLYAMLNGVLKTTVGTPERDKVWESIYRSGSWALVSEASLPMRYLQQLATSDNGQMTYRFNGESYTGMDSLALTVGARLATCVDGDYCSIDNDMLLACRGTGACYSSREEFVRKSYFASAPSSFDKATKFADEIRSAIARGDRSVFH